MFTYVESVGLMETAEHTAWLRTIKKVGNGKLKPLPSFDSDLPQGSVPELSSEIEASCIEMLSEALASSLRHGPNASSPSEVSHG